MSEYVGNAPEKIDLTDLLQNVLKGVQKLWWLVIGLALVFALRSYFTVSSGYVPNYVASVTVAVQSLDGGTTYINRETAEQMAEVFPYLMRNGVLRNAIQEDMGLDYLPGTLTMSVESGTNFFTISSNASDPEVAYELLQAALRQYPEVVKFAVGRIGLEILDETGIPEDTGKEYAVRGSVRNGAIKGATIGLAVMAVYILTINTVKKRKDLKKIINLEDLGSIPYVPMKKRSKKGLNNAVNLNNQRVPQSYLEAIRKLRIKVMQEMEAGGYRSLLITSSVPGEGKTTLAVNLALALARQGKHVVLVDCDLRNPSVAQVMGENGVHPGIGAVLRKEVTIDKVLTDVEVERGKLQVIYGGEPDKNVVQLLGRERMHRAIQALEKYADIVILDTAPSDLMADATILSRYADAALYVVRCDYAKKGRIRNGVSALSESKAKILGYVFNADTSGRSSGYGYGYGYGYKKYGAYGGYGNYYGYGYGARKKDDDSGRVIKD